LNSATPSLRPHPPGADQQFRLLVQGVTDYAIYMLDPEGVITNWNAGGQRIKGYSAAEIVGHHFSRFYTDEDREAGEPERGLLAARSEGRYEKEGWRVRKDGTRFRASVVIDPIWQDGQLIGYAKVTRDVTERYETERRLLETRQALAESQKLEALGKLTYGLAHDFNNLLTVIVNSLELIRARPGDAERAIRLVQVAERASDRGTLLTRQLLAFARGQGLAAEPHDVDELLRESYDLFRRACDESIELHLELAGGLPLASLDKTQFEAAVLNLVVNARDAMPAGGTIRIRTSDVFRAPPAQPGACARRHVCVEVIDTGTGMPEDVLRRATEPFFTTKDVGRGSGLGLSQVHGFAAQSGGFMSLHSKDGQGVRATLCFPTLEDA
jgi:PAS domain S-box-containing protein